MKKIRKLLTSMMIGLAVSTSLVACSGAQNPQNNIEVSDEIVATINGVEVKESLFNFYLLNVQLDFEQLLGPSAWNMDLEGINLGDVAKERALESIVTAIVADNKSKEMGIEITREEEEWAKDNARAYTEANIELLQNHKFLESDVETFLLSSVAIQKLQQQLKDNYIPSEEEIQRYVDENMEQLGTVTAKHVLLKTTDDVEQPLPTEEIDAKRLLAEEILERALAGEDMAALAKQYTEDSGSIATGGEYTFGRGQMVPEFEEAAFGSRAGEVWPEIVETKFGYHIIKTEAHQPAVEEDIRAIYIENERITFVQNEFINMIDSAVVQKTELYDLIQLYQAEDTEGLIEQESLTQDTEQE